MRAVVVALGKIGLPIAVKLGLAGHEVVGCDVDPRVVDLVNAAREPFPGEAGLPHALKELIATGRLQATTDTSRAVEQGPDLIIAVPPLVVDDEARPDFRILDEVTASIGRGLRPGALVSIETTVPVGTTRGRVAPRLAELSGLRPEQEFFCIHSPERVYSGRILSDLDAYPKLIGGLSSEGERLGVERYEAFLGAQVWPMGSAEAAELAKLAETTYRDVNIALANEFARYADRIGVDVQRVIDASNSQPFSHIHRPGVAVGGHCIPVYPRLYLSGDPAARLPATAREINEQMPAYAVDLLTAQLGSLRGARILILGVSFRGGVKETAFSGAFALRDELLRRSAQPVATDPLYTDSELQTAGFSAWDGKPVDGAILQADHGEYVDLTPGELPGIRAVVDGRGIVREEPWAAAGIPLARIGQPRSGSERGSNRSRQDPGAAARPPTAGAVG